MWNFCEIACIRLGEVWGCFKNTNELVNLGAHKFSLINKLNIFQCMGKIFCVEFQREPLKFHTKCLTHSLKETIFIQHWKFRSSQIYELVNVFEMPPWPTISHYPHQWRPGGCFNNVSSALQNNLANIYNARNHIYGENFKLKLFTCAHACTNFELEIFIKSTISAIHKLRDNILESSWNINETTRRIHDGIYIYIYWYHEEINFKTSAHYVNNDQPSSKINKIHFVLLLSKNKIYPFYHSHEGQLIWFLSDFDKQNLSIILVLK